MTQICVHKSCGKSFTDPQGLCIYHPGPPIFHEGQKGWKCCKPRVLTFDEFLAIPPCTTGVHSRVDDTLIEQPKQTAEVPIISDIPISTSSTPIVPGIPQAARTAIPQKISPTLEAEPESEDDNPDLTIPPNSTCRRRGCQETSTDMESREGEKCIHHPGHPVFHEGSKGWSCCKKKVLDFDEFLKIEGCETKTKHMFVGSGKKFGGISGEKFLTTVRHDFYQTGSTIHASVYLKKISKADAQVDFCTPTSIEVDLPTADQTRYKAVIPLFGPIDPNLSKFKILGTKLELNLVKADGQGWPVFRADERLTGEIIQTGNAARSR